MPLSVPLFWRPRRAQVDPYKSAKANKVSKGVAYHLTEMIKESPDSNPVQRLRDSCAHQCRTLQHRCTHIATLSGLDATHVIVLVMRVCHAGSPRTRRESSISSRHAF
jgi:hypothetical protein